MTFESILFYTYRFNTPIVLVGRDAQVSAPQLPWTLLDLQLYCNKGLFAACNQGLCTSRGLVYCGSLTERKRINIILRRRLNRCWQKVWDFNVELGCYRAMNRQWCCSHHITIYMCLYFKSTLVHHGVTYKGKPPLVPWSDSQGSWLVALKSPIRFCFKTFVFWLICPVVVCLFVWTSEMAANHWPGINVLQASSVHLDFLFFLRSSRELLKG